MNKTSLLLLTGLFLIACKEDIQLKVANEFITHFNSANLEEARKLTSDSFVFKSNFNGVTKDKSSYFGDLEGKMLFHLNMKVLKSKSEKNKVILQLENTSDFTTYLKMPHPTFNYSFYFVDNKIQAIQVDSLEGYAKSLREVDNKFSAFESWIKQRYPQYLDSFKRKPYGATTAKLLVEYANRL